MAFTPSTPTLHNRHRAIAEIDRLIEEAERVQAQHPVAVNGAASEGEPARRAVAIQGLATVRLDLLHKSRETLVSGDAGKRALRPS